MATLDAPAEIRFWVLPEGSVVPLGPIALDEIRGRLAGGHFRAIDLACREGDTKWESLSQILAPSREIGPPIIDSAVATRQQSNRLDPLIGSVAKTARSETTEFGLARVLIGAGVAAVLICVAAYWLKPLTASETAERFLEANSVSDAKTACTLKIEPAADAMIRARKGASPGRFEFLEEGPAPAELGGHLVQFRAASFARGGGRRSRVEGLVHLVRAKTWKVEDVYFTAVDSQPTEPPISLALDYRWWLQSEGMPPPPNKTQPPNAVGALHGVRLIASRSKRIFESPTAKWIGGLCAAAAAVVFGARTTKASKETNDKAY